MIHAQNKYIGLSYYIISLYFVSNDESIIDQIYSVTHRKLETFLSRNIYAIPNSSYLFLFNVH